MSKEGKKTLDALVRLAQHFDEGEMSGVYDRTRMNVEFLVLAAPYIHDLLVQQSILDASSHALPIREGRETQAHARVTEVLEIAARIGRECGILRKDLAHLRAELVAEEPISPLSRLRTEKKSGFIGLPGGGFSKS
jgi:hypothetical protein